MGRLENKVAIVTGGTSGIGEGICLAYAAEGAKVVVAGRSIERGEKVVSTIKEIGGEASFIQTDVAKESEIISLIEKTIELYGKLDIMINNAGIGFSGPIEETTSEIWDNVMNTNAKSVFWGIKYSIPELLKTKGALITVSSMGGVKPLPQHYVYSPAKAAAAMVTRVAALQYAADGIRCNVICPGVVDTPIIGSAPPEIKEAVCSTIPMGRLGVPKDIANLAIYLGSDECQWTTGHCFCADGGSTLL